MVNVEELRTCKAKVANILDVDARARDCDKYLYLVYLWRYTNIKEVQVSNFEELAKFILDDKIPTYESIRRVRQKLQEEGKFWGEKREKRNANAKAISEWAING
jgi:hypothetical protein